MISTLVVEDSRTIREYLCSLIEDDPVLDLVGVAIDGMDAVEKVRCLRPQVVLMDIEMPKIDGIEATRRIMAENPVPIVICSANLNHNLTEKSYQAIAAGALIAIAKPKAPGVPGAQVMVDNLMHKLKLMADVKVVRRETPSAKSGSSPSSGLAVEQIFLQKIYETKPQFVVIGASTGGPPALATVLKNLRPNFPLPILVVQHIAEGFLAGMLNWLQDFTKIPLHIASQGEKPLPGNIYFAPDNYHLEFCSNNLLGLVDSPEVYNVKPSVSHLFLSFARPDSPRALGVLLTGMGRDGASEMLAMRARNQLTIAQDAESCVVNGMPGEAERLGAAQIRLNLEAISEMLNQLTA